MMCGVEKQVDKVPLLGLIHGVSWIQAVKKVHTTNNVFSSQSKLVPAGRECQGKHTTQFCTRICPSTPETRLLSASPPVVDNSYCSQLTCLSQSMNSSLRGETASHHTPEQGEGRVPFTEKALSPEAAGPIASTTASLLAHSKLGHIGGAGWRLPCIPLSST